MQLDRSDGLTRGARLISLGCMKRPSLKVEKWMRETLTWLAREFPDSRDDELAMHILYERIAKDPSESQMLFLRPFPIASGPE